MFEIYDAVVCALTIPTATAEAGCVGTWSQCRDDATMAYFNNEVGTIRYSLMLSGCDMGFAFCNMR